MRSRLARPDPGGPAQPLQVSRLHRHASCVTRATSPHPTPSLAPAPPHRRTRTEIVITQAGILGLRSRLARSGPGGPAQPLQASRLHRQASCLTCDTSPHCTAAHRASTLEAQWPQINQCGLCVELQTHHCRTLHACGPPRPSRQRQSPFQRCLLCRTRAWAIIGVRTAAAAAESDV